MATTKHEVELDISGFSYLAVVLLLVIATQSCSSTFRSRHQTAIDMCMSKGGVPILSWFDDKRMSSCEFPPTR